MALRGKCAVCGRNLREADEPRRDGKRWFCSQSCFLQAASSTQTKWKSRPKWRRRIGWTAGVIVALFVGLIALGAAIGAPKAAKSGGSDPNAHVVVADIGFHDDESGGSSDITYGVVLSNRSHVDAVNLTVTVHAVDKHGRSIATDKVPVSVIPAGSTFNVAGEMFPNVTLQIARLEAIVHGSTSATRYQLPVVTDVKLDTSVLGLLDVRGRVRNPYKTPLPQDAAVYALLVNRAGRIVGSATGTTGAAVRPGATVSFAIQGAPNHPTAKPTSARVSIDPCGSIEAFLGTCKAP